MYLGKLKSLCYQEIILHLSFQEKLIQLFVVCQKVFFGTLKIKVYLRKF